MQSIEVNGEILLTSKTLSIMYFQYISTIFLTYLLYLVFTSLAFEWIHTSFNFLF